MIVLVMGVASAGKSTIGRLLAAAIDGNFAEGDRYHPANNIAKLSRGEPLNDDRLPWLQAIARDMAIWQANQRTVVVTCSALKRSYRDILRSSVPALRIVYLTGNASLLQERMAARQGHFMPPSLLTSQLATVEPPAADENTISIDVANSPADIVHRLKRELAP